jgi:hypothetical protein
MLMLPGREYPELSNTAIQTQVRVDEVFTTQKDFGYVFSRLFARGLG